MLNLINLLVSADVWWGLPKKLDFLKTIVNVIEGVLWPILIVVATVGTIYAVYLGINMAKAEESGKRDEAKKHIITVITAMAITVVMILAINLIVIPNIPNWVAGVDNSAYEAILSKTDTKYDEKDEIEAVLGSSYDYSTEKGYEYRFKVDGQNKQLFITYDGNGKVSSVSQE